jgi:hypothetical protein
LSKVSDDELGKYEMWKDNKQSEIQEIHANVKLLVGTLGEK